MVEAFTIKDAAGFNLSVNGIQNGDRENLISRKIFEALVHLVWSTQKNMEDKDIRNWLIENSIQVETIVPDMAGTARGKLIPVEKFTSGSVIRLPESVFTQSVTENFFLTDTSIPQIETY